MQSAEQAEVLRKGSLNHCQSHRDTTPEVHEPIAHCGTEKVFDVEGCGGGKLKGLLHAVDVRSTASGLELALTGREGTEKRQKR